MDVRTFTPGGTAHDTDEALQTEPKSPMRETLPEGWETKEYSSNPGHFYFFNSSLRLSIKNPPQSDGGQEEIRKAMDTTGMCVCVPPYGHAYPSAFCLPVVCGRCWWWRLSW